MATKKKILYIVEAMGGGVFTYIVDLANELVDTYDMYIAYSELKMEIVELDTLIEDLSAYMQSTGRKYADHAATLRSWSARKKRQQKPGAGIPDYTYNKEESL